MFFLRLCCCLANRSFQPVRLPPQADRAVCSFHDDRRSVVGQGRQDADQPSEDEDRPTKAEEGREVKTHGGRRVSSDSVAVSGAAAA